MFYCSCILVKNMWENKKDAEKFVGLKKKQYLCSRKNEIHRGVEQLVARQAHNLEVACSSPASATTSARFVGLFSFSSEDSIYVNHGDACSAELYVFVTEVADIGYSSQILTD